MKRAKRPSRRTRRAPGDEPEQVLHQPELPPPGGVVAIEGPEADHALLSLRVRSGDPVSLVDGRGTRAHGIVVDLDRHRISVRVERSEELPRWPRRSVWLGAGILRTARMETLVEKASELGVERFFPLALKRCVARPGEEGLKADRWHRIAVESLKQSRRAVLLRVEEPTPLDVFLAALPEARDLRVAHPGGEGPGSLAGGSGAAGPVVLVVGPEGGVAEEEVGMLERHGARFVHLGGNRLRAETAGIALVTAWLAGSGEMDPPEPRPDV